MDPEKVLVEQNTHGLGPVTAPDVLPQPQPCAAWEWQLGLLQGGQDVPPEQARSTTTSGCPVLSSRVLRVRLPWIRVSVRR